jgi:hypothetical protein
MSVLRSRTNLVLPQAGFHPVRAARASMIGRLSAAERVHVNFKPFVFNSGVAVSVRGGKANTLRRHM